MSGFEWNKAIQELHCNKPEDGDAQASACCDLLNGHSPFIFELKGGDLKKIELTTGRLIDQAAMSDYEAIVEYIRFLDEQLWSTRNALSLVVDRLDRIKEKVRECEGI